MQPLMFQRVRLRQGLSGPAGGGALRCRRRRPPAAPASCGGGGAAAACTAGSLTSTWQQARC